MRNLLGGMVILALAVPLWGQKIETAVPSRDQVVPVHTALGHLTVIEVGEPVVTVAAGSSAFKIEWRDSKVFIEPTEQGVTTNLFVWTASSRLNYELESAGAVEKMDFAIDYPKPTAAPAKPASPPPPRIEAADSNAVSFLIAPILTGQPVRVDSSKSSGQVVVVLLKDLFTQKGTLFIRYEIRNQSGEVYAPGAPKVFALDGVRSPLSLVGRDSSQLSKAEAEKLKMKGQTLLPVIDGSIRSSKLAPGEDTLGVVAVKLPPSSQETCLLRIDFSSDRRGPVSATLVLYGGA